jgi:cytochrome P450 family 49 subfamily A
LSFVLYNVSKHPEKQELLRAEIARILPNKRPLQKEDLEDLKYLKACVKESFR